MEPAYQHALETGAIVVVVAFVVVILLCKVRSALCAEQEERTFTRYAMMAGGLATIVTVCVLGAHLPPVDGVVKHDQIRKDLCSLRGWYVASTTDAMWESDEERMKLAEDLGERLLEVEQSYANFIQETDDDYLQQQLYVRMWVYSVLTFLGVGGLGTLLYGLILCERL